MSAKVSQRINMVAASDVGSVRKENEDFYYFSKTKKFIVVSDGMGGHQKGALASKVASETLRDVIFASDSLSKLTLRDFFFDVRKTCADIKHKLPASTLKLLAAIRLANRRILNKALAEKRMQGMGTTVASALIDDGHINIAHVGDSRVYRLRQGILTCLTKDHSWLNELIEDREISKEEIQNFKKKNVLTRALGIAPGVKVDLLIEPLQADDLYLLCSDGLSNALSDELIASILTAYHGSLQNKVSNLVTRAKSMDGSDNITGGLIHISGQVKNGESVMSKKFTIEEEPVEVSDYLDQTIKTVYLPSKSPKKSFSTNKPVGIFASIGAACMLALFFLFQNGQPEKNTAVAAQTPLFSGNISSAKQALAPKQTFEPGGQVILLQINDQKYVELFENMEGVRLLDVVSGFKNNNPVYAGNFTWAIADARENILYKRKHINLIPVSKWGERSEVAGERAIQFSNNRTNPSGDNAHIYLIGNFITPDYEDASIFIDEKLLGSLQTYKDDGFYLQSGVYDISIKDIDKRVLNQKLNIQVQEGETIAVEF